MIHPISKPSPAQLKALMPLLLLTACVPSTREAPAVVEASRPPPMNPTGLGSVLGATARTLIAHFGTPDLDIREGTARKLQFGSQICVLDAYLYPRSTGAEPIVTYIDARMPDGRDMDRASCVAAIAARQKTR